MLAMAVHLAPQPGGPVPVMARQRHSGGVNGSSEATAEARDRWCREKPIRDRLQAEVARCIVQCLDRGLEQLPTAVLARLAQARDTALVAARPIQYPSSLPAIARSPPFPRGSNQGRDAS